MSIRCDICSEWSPGTGFGHRDICLPCFERNFAGTLLEAPSAREALDVYVFDVHHPTARQMAALRRIAAQADAREDAP